MRGYEHGGDVYAEEKRPVDFSVNIDPLGMPESVAKAAEEAVRTELSYPDPFCRKLTAALSERYGIGATIANDGNCVALAEAWVGAARGLRDVICVVLGTGVGGGIISGGHLIEGTHGFGGEIGHFPTHADLLMTGEKKWGSHYETFASTGALVRRALMSGKDWLNGKEIFEAAASGDAGALEILDGWTTEIAAGITGLVHIFDPEVVLIGGGVSAQNELLVKPVRDKVIETVTPDMAAELKLRAAELGNNAGMVGAVKYFIDRCGGRNA